MWDKSLLYNEIRQKGGFRGPGGVTDVPNGGEREELFEGGGEIVPHPAGDQHRDAEAGGMGRPAAVCSGLGREEPDGRGRAAAGICRADAKYARRNPEGVAGASRLGTRADFSRSEREF